MPPDFDRFESFGHDELTAKHGYFRCSRPSDVNVIKIFDKDDQATKHCSFRMLSGAIMFMHAPSQINLNLQDSQSVN